MELSLKVLSGKLAGKEIPIASKEFVIGRAEGCHLRAQSDLISRRHCALAVDSYSATVRDLGSRNGTFINGEKIEGERPLVSGDKLTIGQFKFEVHMKSSLGGPKKPKVVDVKDAAQRTIETIPESDDSEVANWLKEASVQETLTGHNAETLTGPVLPVEPDPEPAAAPPKHSRRDEEETLVQGSRGERPRPQATSGAPTKDSQEAAAELLRKLRMRRK